jgi:hypothetical protein
MASNMPPPPPPDRPASSSRPTVVTVAGVLLIVGGALAALAGILLLAGAGVAAGSGVGGLFLIVALIVLAIGILQIYAGTQVLALKERGRQIGIWFAGIAGVLSLLSIGRTPGSSIIQIAIDAFIIWALISNQQYFTA